MATLKRIRRRLLRWFAYIEEPFAWIVMFAGLAAIIAVVIGLVARGEAQFGALLGAVIVFITGFTAVQNTDDD